MIPTSSLDGQKAFYEYRELGEPRLKRTLAGDMKEVSSPYPGEHNFTATYNPWQEQQQQQQKQQQQRYGAYMANIQHTYPNASMISAKIPRNRVLAPRAPATQQPAAPTAMAQKRPIAAIGPQDVAPTKRLLAPQAMDSMERPRAPQATERPLAPQATERPLAPKAMERPLAPQAMERPLAPQLHPAESADRNKDRLHKIHTMALKRLGNPGKHQNSKGQPTKM